MRNYKQTKKNKSGKRGQSRRLKGGNTIANFFGFGRNTPSPQAAQAQQVAESMADEIAGHEQEAQRKEQEAVALRNQCNDYENNIRRLQTEAAEHTRTSQEIMRGRESKNRCDARLGARLQGIEQGHQRRIEELTAQANQELEEENQRAQQEYTQCLREGMSLSPQPITQAQQLAAARAIQERRRRQVQERQAQPPTDGEQEPEVNMIGGRKTRRKRSKTRPKTRKTRRGGTIRSKKSGKK